MALVFPVLLFRQPGRRRPHQVVGGARPRAAVGQGLCLLLGDVLQTEHRFTSSSTSQWLTQVPQGLWALLLGRKQAAGGGVTPWDSRPSVSMETER